MLKETGEIESYQNYQENLSVNRNTTPKIRVSLHRNATISLNVYDPYHAPSVAKFSQKS